MQVGIHDVFDLFMQLRSAQSLCATDEREIFFGGHVGIERRLLGQIAYQALCLVRLLADVVSAYEYLSLRRRETARDDVHRRTLARTVRPEKTVYLSALYLEREIGYGNARTVLLCQMLYFNHCDFLSKQGHK